MLAEFFSYYRPHMRLFWLDFGCAVLSGLLELGFPLAVSAFIDRLLPQGDWTLTIIVAVFLFAIYVFNAMLKAIVTYWGHKLGVNIETEMRARAFAHLTQLSWGWFDHADTGKLAARVTRDLEEIGEVAHHGPEDLFIAAMTFAGAFGMMYWMHPQLATLTLVIVPLMFWLLIVYGGRMTRTWQAIYARVGAFNLRLNESLGGIRIVQAFTNEHHERKLFANDNQRYRATKLEAYRVMAGLITLHYLGMRLIQIIVMVVGAWYVFQNTLSTGEFVGFLLLVNIFFRPLEQIAAVIETYPRGIAGFRRYLELLAAPMEIQNDPDAKPAPELVGQITFHHVSFSYDENQPVLRDISLRIEPGQTIAIVGHSGAGKSSLLAMIPRFYNPTSGHITIDDLPLNSMTLESLRSQIGLVSQEVFLFGGTLRENILYGKLDATESELDEAIEKAQLRAFVDRLPDGLDTIVGERGVLLSGGQRQRVAIARVILSNPPILLLDEATSALDRNTEREIQSALDHLAQGRTTIVVAHRLETINQADLIVVLEEGSIVETGQHADLLSNKAAYYHLSR